MGEVGRYETLIRMYSHRKDFLKLLAAVTAMPPVALSAPQQAAAPSSKAEEFAGRLMEDLVTAWRGALCYIGDRLGIYKAMAVAGPVTVEDLARRTKLNPRLLREWLGAMATAQYVEYRPTTKKYFLPPEHAAVLADEAASPLFLGGMIELVVPMVAASNKVAEAFRTGHPITMNDFASELFEGMERASAPNFKHRLVQEWIPAMPDVHARLQQGGKTVDLGCGSGLASIMLARGYPKARCFGYDPHGPSIERARASAKAANLSDRVQFVVGDASRIPAGEFDLLTVFDSVHHFSDPVGVLTSARKALARGASCFLQEPVVAAKVEDNVNLAGRLSYTTCTLWCLHDSMANNGAGIGSDLSEPLMRELARRSCFTQFKRLPNSDPLEALYVLKA